GVEQMAQSRGVKQAAPLSQSSRKSDSGVCADDGGCMSATDEADGGAIESKVFGEFYDYNSLVALLRQCKDARQVSFATIDEVGGLPTGQSSKILAPM